MLYKTGKCFAGQPKNISPRQSSYSILGNITKTIPELDEWIESEGIKKEARWNEKILYLKFKQKKKTETKESPVKNWLSVCISYEHHPSD